jgi:hypothetical protein
VCQHTSQLSDRKDEDEVEEQFESRDALDHIRACCCHAVRVLISDDADPVDQSTVLNHSSVTGERRVRQRSPAGVHPGQRRPEETTVSTDLTVVRMRRVA